MISYLADLLKVGNENAQKLKKQREDEAKKEIEQELFESQITAHPKQRDGFGFPFYDGQIQPVSDKDGLYRFIGMGRVSAAKNDLKGRYPIRSDLSLYKTFALFKRYGGGESDMRKFIGSAISELETTKYNNAIHNTKIENELRDKFFANEK